MTQPIHILIVQPYPYIVGPHQVMARLVRQLQGERYRFSVVTTGEGPAAADFRSMGVEVVCIPEAAASYRTGNPARLAGMAARLAVGSARVVRYVRARRFDLVHSTTAQCWVGGIAARLAGLPSVYHVHDLTLASPRPVGWLMAHFLNLTADRIICVSEAARRALPVAGLSSEKTTVIYNGVDTDEFRPGLPEARLMAELGIGARQPVVAAIGLLDYRKGQDILIRATARLRHVFPDICVLMVGDIGPKSRENGYVQLVERTISELNLAPNVQFVGPRTDISRLLNSVDLLVQPSRIEAGALAPLEAMSCGIPVVATDVGANPEEVMDGVTGLIVRPEDPEAMSEAILSLLQDGSRRRQMGRAGRKRVEQLFNLRKQSEAVAEVYERLVTDHLRSAPGVLRVPDRG